MPKPIWVSVCLALIIGLLASGAWAIERELAGVRLGDRALELLDRPGFGQPNFIGPLGTLGYVAPQQAQPTRAAAGPVGPSRAAAAGVGMRGGGMRGAGMRGGGMRGAGMRGGGMRGGGMRGGGMRGGGMRGAGARGGAMRMGAAGGRAGGARARTAAPGGARPEGAGMYWYYRRPGGAVLLLTLTQTGQVRAVTLTGNAPYVRGRTTRGITLTSSYMELISQYGYPDQIVTGGTILELTYVDHGVRFTLDNMRVTEISIGPHIAAAFQPEPEVTPQEVLPPAGLSVEELRGYL